MKTISFNFRVGLISLLMLFSLPLSLFALEIGEQEVAVTVTESYASRFISEGRDCFPDDDPIWETALDIELPGLLYGTDFAFSVWWAYPLKSGQVAAEELDYSLALSRDIKEKINISAGYNYFDLPKDNNNADANEFWGSFTLNELPLLPIPVSATLYAAYEFRATVEGPEDGWFYSWGFATELDLPGWQVFQEEQKLCLDITNWGTDGVGGLKSSSLYASEYSVSTDYNFAGFTITPSFHYLSSYEDEINDEDEIWGRIDISYSF